MVVHTSTVGQMDVDGSTAGARGVGHMVVEPMDVASKAVEYKSVQ